MKELLSDHSDFEKTKRAFMASSVALIVVQALTFQSDHIEVFKLKLAVDAEKLIFAAQAACLYFFVIFIFRAVPFTVTAIQSDRLDTISRKAKEISKLISIEINEVTQKELRELIDQVRSGSPFATLTESERNLLNSMTQEFEGLPYRLETGSRKIVQAVIDKKTRWVNWTQDAEFVAVNLVAPLLVFFVALVFPTIEKLAYLLDWL
ncbi:hypothetical protein BXY66_1191 [Shimia isoporae]|uniref:Uncharacterized protein n=1 Tax=Shimia isoporae TaxID=647720 RepID=A0A4R1NLB7_9RHOB|nr:hypothetical protein [Shimia isoporae]TCL09147.1 hypothetical protein BXY66_1191 [Shimia isoporae]